MWNDVNWGISRNRPYRRCSAKCFIARPLARFAAFPSNFIVLLPFPWPHLIRPPCKLAPAAGAPAYRTAPHNIEAEQSLLGAILVNNDAFYRVSDFLEPRHFFEPIHQHLYEIAGSLIRLNKIATPVTLKTFVPAETDIGGMTVAQYLARLAAEATTIINAQDYGRTIYDLALRRDLIRIGEDLVNEAFDSPVNSSPRQQIEEAEKRLYEIAESGRYDGGFQRFANALTAAVDMAANAYKRDGGLSGIATGLRDLDAKMGGLQSSDLIIIAGRPGMAKTSLASNIGYNIAKTYRGEVQADGQMKTVDGGIVGFFSLEMSAEQLATRIVAERTGIPSSTIRRGGITEAEFEKIRDNAIELQSLPFYIDETGGLSIAQLCARARRLKRQKGLDLLIVDYIQLLVGLVEEVRQPRAGSHRDHHQPEGAGQGAAGPDRGAVAAVASGGKPRRQASAALGPARVRIDRAGRRRGAVPVPRRILSAEQGAAARHARARKVADRDGPRARQGRSDHRQAASRPDRRGRSALRSRRSPASPISRLTAICPTAGKSTPAGVRAAG